MKQGYVKRSIMAGFVVLVSLTLNVPLVSARSICTVNTTQLRLRQKPTKKAHVVTNLNKGSIVVAEDTCAGGWVKVRSEDGRFSGYVGGWALTPVNFSEESKSAVSTNTAESETQKAVRIPVVAVQVGDTDVSSNEKLAIQITELRLKVLAIEKSIKNLKKDVRSMKESMKLNTKK